MGKSKKFESEILRNVSFPQLPVHSPDFDGFVVRRREKTKILRREFHTAHRGLMRFELCAVTYNRKQ